MNKFAYELGKQTAKVALFDPEDTMESSLTTNALLGALLGAPAGAVASPEGRSWAGAGVGAASGSIAGILKPLLYDILKQNKKTLGYRAPEALATLPTNTALSAFLANKLLDPIKKK